MGDKKNSSLNNLKYVFVLVGVIAIVAAYFLGFTKYNSKCEDIDSEISSLKSEYDSLKTLADVYTVDGVKEYVEECDKEYGDIIAGFDGGIKYQSVIMDTYKMTVDREIQIPALTMGTVDENLGNETLEPFMNENGYTVQKMAYTFATKVPYDKMLDTIRYIINYDGKRKVPTSIAFAYDTNNQEVTLSFGISEYALTGEGREITIPEIPGYVQGDTNIFYDEAVKVEPAQ